MAKFPFDSDGATAPRGPLSRYVCQRMNKEMYAMDAQLTECVGCEGDLCNVRGGRGPKAHGERDRLRRHARRRRRLRL